MEKKIKLSLRISTAFADSMSEEELNKIIEENMEKARMQFMSHCPNHIATDMYFVKREHPTEFIDFKETVLTDVWNYLYELKYEELSDTVKDGLKCDFSFNGGW